MFYFVENALEAEVFGKDFDAGWGPLDSSVVKDNLKIKTSPYDTRPNMVKKWSDDATFSSPDGGLATPNMSTIGNLFDGDLSTNFALNTTNDKTARLTFTPCNYR